MKSLFAILIIFTSLALPAAFAAERLRLTDAHLDLAIVLEPQGTNLLALGLHDEDHQLEHDPQAVLLVVPAIARTPIPEGFSALGPAGSELWILPASQEPGRLLLGLSGEELTGQLAPQRVDLFLRRVEGPGHFLAWQMDGDLHLSVNSRDGLGPEDRFTPFVGGHEHHNYGFSTNGLYTLWFQARATVSGTNAWSPETPIVFAVEPVPAVVAAPATLTASSPEPDGALLLFLSGTPGAVYQLEHSANLRDWKPIGEVTAGSVSQRVSLPLSARNPPQFFRAVTP